MKISKKFFLINFLIIFLVCCILLFVFLIIDYNYQRKNLIKGLKNVNEIFVHAVDVYVNEGIENYLKMLYLKDKVYIDQILKKYYDKIISKNEAKEKIKEYLRNVKIGDTGYVFIWNIKDAPQKIILDLHPEIEGQDVSYVDFVQIGAKKKEGYLEYLWGNPSDKSPRYKSMYLAYIKDFDWVIAYSSYKDEFYKFIDIEKFETLINDIKIFGYGNTYIIDYNGNIFFHKVEKGNFKDVKDIKGKYFIREILEKKEGVISYYWKDYSDPKERIHRKIAYFSPIEKFSLIIISSIFIKDAFNYYYQILFISTFIIFLFLIFSIFLTGFLTNKLLTPFYTLQNTVKKMVLLNLNFKSINNYNEENKLKLLENINKKDFKDDEFISFSKFFENIIIDLNEINLKLNLEFEKEKILRNEIEYQKNLIDNILNIFPFGVVVIDLNGLIINYNKYFFDNYISEIFKNDNTIFLNNKNFIDYPFYEILKFEENEFFNKKSLQEEIIKYFDNNRSLYEKKLEIYLNGELRHFDINAIPFYKEDKIDYIIIKIEDITNEVKRILWDTQAQKLESLSNLIRGLSHDLNNYIAAINGTISLFDLDLEEDIEFLKSTIEGTSINKTDHLVNKLNVLKEKLSINYKENINIIDDSVKKSSNLIKKLNVFSKVKESDYLIIDLIAIINRVIEISKSSFDKFVEIRFLYDKNKKYFVKAIEEQIETLFLNLFINSYQSMIENNEENLSKINIIEISIENVKLNNKQFYKISLKDNGKGIPDEIKSKIFDPFFTTKKKEKGVGLGLYIVNNVINNHNGYIDFDSKVNEGTVFNVYLPVYAIEEKEKMDFYEVEKSEKIDEKIDNELKTTENKSDQKDKSNINDKRDKNSKNFNILVIDDEESIRYFLKKGLERKGFKVKVAENGVKGIDLFLKEKNYIDLVILDFLMPIFDGKQTFLELKKIREDIKVIMMSGFIDDVRIKECMNLGVIDFIGKPFELNHLIEKINQNLV
jgi:nitrogen-specific signal transduction histidine kinase/CheY-like chemotaxis protein